jgi:hypothetical protein
VRKIVIRSGSTSNVDMDTSAGMAFDPRSLPAI